MTLKLALVMGLEYTDTRNYLPGCINDATAIKKLLLMNGYDDKNIVMMTDRSKNGRYPTSKNILRQLRMLVNRANKDGASRVWISYSGHGGSTRDRGTDESDGKDETIFALDEKDVLDDLLHRILRRMNKKTEVFGLFDSCHSGTVCDLSHSYKYSNNLTLKYSRDNNHKVRSRIVTVSGCTDKQNSFSIDIGTKWVGALTQAFLKLVNSLGTTIRHQRIGRFLTRKVTLDQNLPQRPVISSSQKLNRKRPIILL